MMENAHLRRTILIGRREFTLQAVLALLSGATITVAGCSDSGSNPSAPSGSDTDGISGTISLNHGHRAFISSAQLQAGNAITLDIRGSATHPHSVTLSGDEIMTIAGGGRVASESSLEDAHTHTVTFN